MFILFSTSGMIMRLIYKPHISLPSLKECELIGQQVIEDAAKFSSASTMGHLIAEEIASRIRAQVVVNITTNYENEKPTPEKENIFRNVTLRHRSSGFTTPGPRK